MTATALTMARVDVVIFANFLVEPLIVHPCRGTYLSRCKAIWYPNGHPLDQLLPKANMYNSNKLAAPNC